MGRAERPRRWIRPAKGLELVGIGVRTGVDVDPVADHDFLFGGCAEVGIFHVAEEALAGFGGAAGSGKALVVGGSREAGGVNCHGGAMDVHRTLPGAWEGHAAGHDWVFKSLKTLIFTLREQIGQRADL